MEVVSEQHKLAERTTRELEDLYESDQTVVVLLPVGSTEPHGPHLPLDVDTTISRAASAKAAEKLDTPERTPLLAPSVSYGTTACAAAFAGAISVSPGVLTPFLEEVVQDLLADGTDHVCLVNNHLEPAHDRAVRDAVTDLPEEQASVATPLKKRWARTLSEEFKTGACHAGQYETSIVLASREDQVRRNVMKSLPEVNISLSENLEKGVTDFLEMGMEDAYAGRPADATAGEGEEMLNRLATMIATEVRESLNEQES